MYVYIVNHSLYDTSDFYKLTNVFSRMIHGPLVILGLTGCVIAWLPMSRNILSEKALFVYRVVSLILLYFLFIHAVTFADARYGVPLRPIIALLVMMSLFFLGSWMKKLFILRTRKPHQT
jgi:hypothetical protein